MFIVIIITAALFLFKEKYIYIYILHELSRFIGRNIFHRMKICSILLTSLSNYTNSLKKKMYF